MDVTAAMLVEGRRQARLCEAFNGNAGAREWKPLGHTTLGTLPVPGDCGHVGGKTSGKLWNEHRKITVTSSGASICGRRDRPIRKKIIGHDMSTFRERFSRGNVLLPLLRAFSLVHQPARQHGCGSLLHPKIEKGANLLTEIGGMAKTRKFITLQRSSRSREKKLPWRLGFVVGHGAS
jgi:hypothetical protein